MGQKPLQYLLRLITGTCIVQDVSTCTSPSEDESLMTNALFFDGVILLSTSITNHSVQIGRREGIFLVSNVPVSLHLPCGPFGIARAI
jgi:hypothetical protein